MSKKQVRDFVYYAAKVRGIPERDSIALAKFLQNYLTPTSGESK